MPAHAEVVIGIGAHLIEIQPVERKQRNSRGNSPTGRSRLVKMCRDPFGFMLEPRAQFVLGAVTHSRKHRLAILG